MRCCFCGSEMICDDEEYYFKCLKCHYILYSSEIEEEDFE